MRRVSVPHSPAWERSEVKLELLVGGVSASLLGHLFLRTLHVNLWKHQLVSAGISIVYLKKSQVDSYLERVFPCWKFGILLKGLLKVPAPAMASSGSSTAGMWPDPAVLGYKLTEKNKIEPSDCTIWC